VSALAPALGLVIDAHLVELAQGTQAVPVMQRRFLADCRHVRPALGLGFRYLGLPPAAGVEQQEIHEPPSAC